MQQTQVIPSSSIYLWGSTVALLSLIGILWPPYTTAAVIGILFSGCILVSRPDIAFALFIAIETLISEDILLITEKLDVTLYRVPLPYIGLNIFEVALLLLIFTTILQRKGVIYGTRLDFCMGLFGLACLAGYATCIWLYHEPSRVFEPRRLLHFFAAYYLTVNLIRTEESLKLFLWIYFAAIVCKSVEGVFLYSMGEGLQIKWKIRAIFTGWEDSLNFVTYLLFMGVFILDRQNFPWKKGFLIAAPAVFFSFLFSYKRAYYLAFLAGLISIFWMQNRRSRIRFLAWGILAGLLMGIIIVAAGQWQAIGMRLDSILHPTKESSANYRLLEWQNAYISIRNHPFFGIGLGGIMPMEKYLARTNLLGVHNTFLWVTVKMGVLGIFSYLLLHFVFLRGLIMQNQKIRSAFLRTVSRAITCSFLAFATAELFAPMFAQMRTATWLGIMLGIGMMLTHCDCIPEYPSSVDHSVRPNLTPNRQDQALSKSP